LSQSRSFPDALVELQALVNGGLKEPGVNRTGPRVAGYRGYLTLARRLWECFLIIGFPREQLTKLGSGLSALSLAETFLRTKCRLGQRIGGWATFIQNQQRTAINTTLWLAHLLCPEVIFI
jgi:hypothetical protein